MRIFWRGLRAAKLPLPSAEAPRDRLLGAIRHGVHHIWTGYDHLLFLRALLLPSVLRREDRHWLPAERLRPALIDVLKVVTAFTAAHSVTLSLADFALGLLHGFGFSSTLADLGLDRASLIPTPVGFNLGVELGQAAVVAVFGPLAFAARRREAYRLGALQLGSVAISIVALLWLVERALDIAIITR